MHAAVVCLLCVGMLVACGRTRPPQIGGPPPVVESTTPAELGDAKLQAKNIRTIHQRLFQDGQHHFDGGYFQQAIREFTRLLALHPQTDLQKDGQWWLGQSYDQIQDWEAAQRAYQHLASAPIGQRYQADSVQRLHDIQELLEQQRLPPKNTQAIRFRLNQLPGPEGFAQGIDKMKQDGATTLLLDLGCQRVKIQHVSSSNAEKLSEIEKLHELLRFYVEQSHRAGLLMYIGVNLRCMGNWASSQPQGWRDRMYDPETKQFQATRQFDLFHPAYQNFLLRFLAKFCEEGVDGLVFLNDHPLGLFDGLTRMGVKRFEKQFGVGFDPTRVFSQGFDPLVRGKGSQVKATRNASASQDSLFWRWAGWKARERLTILERIIDRLRLPYASIQFGLELHPHGLTDPVGALVKYADDAMDAAGRSFSFFFIRPEIDRRSTFTEQGVIDKLRRISTKAILDRLLPVVDDPRRIWVSVPTKGGQRLRLQTTSSEVSRLRNFPSGIGLVHDFRAFS